MERVRLCELMLPVSTCILGEECHCIMVFISAAVAVKQLPINRVGIYCNSTLVHLKVL